MKHDDIGDILLHIDDIIKNTNRKVIGVAMIVYTDGHNHDILVAGTIPSTYDEHLNELSHSILEIGTTFDRWNDCIPGKC